MIQEMVNCDGKECTASVQINSRRWGSFGAGGGPIATELNRIGWSYAYGSGSQVTYCPKCAKNVMNRETNLQKKKSHEKQRSNSPVSKESI